MRARVIAPIALIAASANYANCRTPIAPINCANYVFAVHFRRHQLTIPSVYIDRQSFILRSYCTRWKDPFRHARPTRFDVTVHFRGHLHNSMSTSHCPLLRTPVHTHPHAHPLPLAHTPAPRAPAARPHPHRSHAHPLPLACRTHRTPRAPRTPHACPLCARYPLTRTTRSPNAAPLPHVTRAPHARRWRTAPARRTRASCANEPPIRRSLPH